MIRLISTLAIAALFVAACEKSTAPSGRSEIVAAWKSNGLKVGDLNKSDGKGVGSEDCQAGSVEGLEVTLCSFATAKDAVLAEDKGLALVGDNTGASIAQGPVLLVVADRGKSDPEGKTLDKLTKVFRGKN